MFFGVQDVSISCFRDGNDSLENGNVKSDYMVQETKVKHGDKEVLSPATGPKYTFLIGQLSHS